MARAGGAGPLQTEEQNARDKSLCELVALGMPTKFIQDSVKKQLGIDVDAVRISLFRNPDRNLAKKWRDLMSLYSQDFIRRAEGEPFLFPVIRARVMYLVARKRLGEGEYEDFFRAMELGDRFQQKIPGNRLLEDFSLSGLVEDAGADGQEATEEITFSVVMKRVRQVRAQGMEAVKKLLPEGGKDEKKETDERG